MIVSVGIEFQLESHLSSRTFYDLSFPELLLGKPKPYCVPIICRLPFFSLSGSLKDLLLPWLFWNFTALGLCVGLILPTTGAFSTCWFFYWSFSRGSDGKESACSARDLGFIPGSGRYPGKGNGYLLQYSCLENSMDRGISAHLLFGHFQFTLIRLIF